MVVFPICLIVLALFLTLFDLTNKCLKGRRSFYSDWMINAAIRFLYEFSLDFFIVILVQLSWASGSNFTYAVIGLITAIAIIIFLVSRLWIGGPYVNGTYASGSLP